jgi:hypothetical protein
MSKYVVAFRGQPGGATSADEEQAWGAWFGQLGPTVTDRGNRVGATRTLPAAHRGDPGTSVLRGYVVIEADNLDDAARLATGCPGLAGAVDVEVAEVVPA